MDREAIDALGEVYQNLSSHWETIARDAARMGDINEVYDAVREARAAQTKIYRLRRRYIG